MRLKKLGAALVVVAALGAGLASSALAAAVTEDVKWYTGASPGTELSGSEMITFAAGGGTFTTEVGTTKYELNLTGIECVFCKIENSGGKAVGSGQLQFSGITVLKPLGCTAPLFVTTKALSLQAEWMWFSGSEPNYIKFMPTLGEGTEFAKFVITGCALETTLVLKGSLFVESTNATGTQEVEHELRSSEAINAAAGGNLHVGTKNAVLAGSTRFWMNGAKFETAFGTH
jgi:hypothetical protein